MSQPSPPPSSKIFISYRRNDTAGHAGRLYDRLAAHFGEAQIFMDIEHIEPGVDFVEAIREAVGACVALIVLIGRDWLDTADEGGRRLDDPNDFVRLEVGAALERGVRVIPVLVQGAKMPRPQSLPESLVGLSRRNAVELSDTRWKYDVDELIETLDRVLARQREEQGRAAEAEASRRAAEAEMERQRREAEATEARRHEAEEAEARRREADEARRGKAEAEEAARRERAEAARREAEAERQRREAQARREEELRRERVAAEERRAREAEEAERRREEAEGRRDGPFADYDAPPAHGRRTLPLALAGLAAAVGVAAVVFFITRPSAPTTEKSVLDSPSVRNQLTQKPDQTAATSSSPTIQTPAADDRLPPIVTPSAGQHPPQTVATPRAQLTELANKVVRPATVVEEKPTPTPPPKPRAPVSGGVLNGRAVSKPAPQYPAVAKATGASGTVAVQVTVDESGRVVSARAVSGHPLLQPAAVQAAYGARFSPTLISGQPVKVTGTLTYNFN